MTRGHVPRRSPRRLPFRVAPGLSAAFLLATAGCYRNVGLATTPVPGSSVVATLTSAASDDFAGYLGPGAQRIQGQVETFDADSLALAVNAVVHRDGVRDQWQGETVRLPRTAVAQLELRHLSVSRSILSAVLAVAAAAGMTEAFQAVSSGSGTTGGATTTR